MYVYWIHHKDQADIWTAGYVGVSADPTVRLEQHRKSTVNNLLAGKLRNPDVICQLILQAPEQYCYQVEQQLRPQPNIGWNLNAGGIKPPGVQMIGEDNPRYGKPGTMSGRKHSEQTKQKMRAKAAGRKSPMEGKKHSDVAKAAVSAANKGRTPWNKGLKYTMESLRD